MKKKYYWKINGFLYEISKEQYYKYRKEQDRHNYLKKNEKAAVIMSLDTLGIDGKNGEVFLPDVSINVEDEVIHKIMLEKLSSALNKLSTEELLLIDLIYTKLKTEREVSEITGIPQTTVCYRKKRILNKLKKDLEN